MERRSPAGGNKIRLAPRRGGHWAGGNKIRLIRARAESSRSYCLQPGERLSWGQEITETDHCGPQRSSRHGRGARGGELGADGSAPREERGPEAAPHSHARRTSQRWPRSRSSSSARRSLSGCRSRWPRAQPSPPWSGLRRRARSWTRPPESSLLR